MRRIPTSFQLMGHTIAVRVVPVADWPYPDADGFWDPGANEILLVEQPQRSQLWHTFWHEAVHACLDMMSHRLSHNERFVDQFGGLLAQLVASAKHAPAKNPAP